MRRSISGAVFATVLLAACAGDAEDDSMDADAQTPVPGAAVQDTGAAGLQTMPSEVGAATLDVRLNDSALALSQNSLQAGLVSFNVANAGSAPHRFRLTGNGEEVETDELAPGADVMMTMNLTAGTYQATCSMQGHNHGPAASITVR